jgi:hypothetical protein
MGRLFFGPNPGQDEQDLLKVNAAKEKMVQNMQHYYCSLYRGTEPLLKLQKQPEVTITAKILKKPSEKTRYFFICLFFPMFWRTRFCLTFPVSAHG